MFPKSDFSKKCSVCQVDKYKKHKGKDKPKRTAWLWDIPQQLKMRLNWRGFEQKLEPIPKTAHANCAPNVASSPLVPEKVRQTINVITETRLGAYVFLLALACDGFQPWRGVQYTMWFLAVRILNLKMQHIASVAELITIGIISGPREPATLQYYADEVVQQLLLFQANRVTIARSLPDGCTVDVLVLAFLVAVIGDYPALCKMLHVQGVGRSSLFLSFFLSSFLCVTVGSSPNEHTFICVQVRSWLALSAGSKVCV